MIVEPVVGNMGCVPPQPGYLEALREITAREGTLLIFDEVMTGFRVAFGGASELYNIKPDLTTLGKIIGGGLPVGAYGGPAKIMDLVAPVGPVYQAGTLSGNPLAMAAGIATLCQLKANREKFYQQLDENADKLVAGVTAAANEAGVAMTANRVGSMFTFFFTGKQVTDWESAATCDTAKFGRFHGALLDAGVWLPPSQFEAAFLSVAHTQGDIDETIAAAREALECGSLVILTRQRPQLQALKSRRTPIPSRSPSLSRGLPQAPALRQSPARSPPLVLPAVLTLSQPCDNEEAAERRARGKHRNRQPAAADSPLRPWDSGPPGSAGASPRWGYRGRPQAPQFRNKSALPARINVPPPRAITVGADTLFEHLAQGRGFDFAKL